MIGLGKKSDARPEAPTIEVTATGATPIDEPEAEGAEAKATRSPLPDLPPTSGADKIVMKWTKWAAGFGLVPLPLVDFVTTSGFSMKMLHSLSKYYGVEFRAEIGKSALTSLVGGASSPMMALMAGSLLKSIPFIGQPLAMVSGPVVAGGVTYAIGKVFTAHFGAGGTLFDFDPESFRDYFQQQINVGKELIKGEKSPPS